MDFLLEAQGQVKHIEHLEDMLFINGVSGTRNVINMLIALRNSMYGTSSKKLDIKTKWDGAPAIIFGYHPETHKFFVGTKGVFAKNAKINYTKEDILVNHESSELQEKLELALEYLSKVTPKGGIYQGDFLYSKKDLEHKNVKGINYITFRPNTIVYAIEKDSHIAQDITKAKFGIVVHTRYTGNTISSLQAHFDVTKDEFKSNSAIWLQDAEYRNQTGNVSLSKEENAYVSEKISELGSLFRNVSKETFDFFVTNSNLRIKFLTFVNDNIRRQKFFSMSSQALAEFISYYSKRLEKDIEEYKTDKSKNRVREILSQDLEYISKNEKQILNIIEMYIKIFQLKVFFITKLNSIQTLSTFLKTSDGLEVTTPEGFVATDLSGSIVKLVDRLNFSYQNFTAEKNWVKK